MLKRHSGGVQASDSATANSDLRTPSPAPSAAESSNVEAVSESSLPAVWREVLEQFRQREKGLYALVEHAEVGSVSGGQVVLRLGAGQGHVPKLLETLGRKEKITTALSTALGKPVGIKVEVAPPPTPPANPTSPGHPTSAPGGSERLTEAAAPRVAKPSRAEIEEMARRMGEGPTEALAQAAASAMPGAVSTAVKVTPELEEELKQDELVRAVVESLGAAIVRVTEE
jgi:hypothetical protein